VAALQSSFGHTVVAIGCGTGLDFDLMQQRIGPRGRIVGVDLTPGMLSKAGERAEKSGRSNVHLIQSDVAAFEYPRPVDGALSTLFQTLAKPPCGLAKRRDCLS